MTANGILAAEGLTDPKGRPAIVDPFVLLSGPLPIERSIIAFIHVVGDYNHAPRLDVSLILHSPHDPPRKIAEQSMATPKTFDNVAAQFRLSMNIRLRSPGIHKVVVRCNGENLCDLPFVVRELPPVGGP